MSWQRDDAHCTWQWIENGAVVAETSDAMLARAGPLVRQVMEASFACRNMPPLPVAWLIKVAGLDRSKK